MYSVFDDKGYMSLKFKTIKEVEKCAEDWRDDYIGNGVDFDSHISIVEWDDDENDFKEIKSWNIEIDIEKHNVKGSPSDNGYDFEFWAKWTKPYETNRYKKLWGHEKSVR